MAGNQYFEEKLRLMTPHTFNALTKLVMAMAAVTKNSGKKTFLGRDKGQESYSKFLAMLKATLQAMVLDGLIRESTSTEEVIAELDQRLNEFSIAFPNWKDAYAYAYFFFRENATDAIATVERLRSMP